METEWALEWLLVSSTWRSAKCVRSSWGQKNWQPSSMIQTSERLYWFVPAVPWCKERIHRRRVALDGLWTERLPPIMYLTWRLIERPTVSKFTSGETDHATSNLEIHSKDETNYSYTNLWCQSNPYDYNIHRSDQYYRKRDWITTGHNLLTEPEWNASMVTWRPVSN